MSLRLAWAMGDLVPESSLQPRTAYRRFTPGRTRLWPHNDQSRRRAGHYLIAKHSYWLWVRAAAESQRLRRLLGPRSAASGGGLIRREMWAPLPHIKKVRER